MTKKNAKATINYRSERKKSGMFMVAMLGTALSSVLSLVMNGLMPFIMDPFIVEKYPIIRGLPAAVAPLAFVIHLPISLIFFYFYYKITICLFREDKYPSIYMYLFGGIYLSLQAFVIFASWDAAFMEPAVSDPGAPILIVASVALVFAGTASTLAATLVGYIVHYVVRRREKSTINAQPAEPQDEPS